MPAGLACHLLTFVVAGYVYLPISGTQLINDYLCYLKFSRRKIVPAFFIYDI